MSLLPVAVYLLCALTSAACAGLLVRGYRRSRVKLLLWSSLCFVGLALNNMLLFVDMVVLTGVDLTVWRSIPALIGFAVALHGLIAEIH
jgi:hypothetical protein